MKDVKEAQILDAIRKGEPTKKRVTFFITERSKSALSEWCRQHEVSESSAIEEMIKATVPARFFKED
jgi:hypothetical protein